VVFKDNPVGGQAMVITASGNCSKRLKTRCYAASLSGLIGISIVCKRIAFNTFVGLESVEILE